MRIKGIDHIVSFRIQFNEEKIQKLLSGCESGFNVKMSGYYPRNKFIAWVCYVYRIGSNVFMFCHITYLWSVYGFPKFPKLSMKMILNQPPINRKPISLVFFLAALKLIKSHENNYQTYGVLFIYSTMSFHLPLVVYPFFVYTHILVSPVGVRLEYVLMQLDQKTKTKEK